MSILPEKGWWGPTKPGGSFTTSQPFAHVIGGLVYRGVGRVLWPDWNALQWSLWVIFLAALWQSLRWEPEPDGTYPFRWMVYDVATALLAAWFVPPVLLFIVRLVA